MREKPLTHMPAHVIMKWPGTSDPTRRRKVFIFLIITAIIGISVAAASTVIQTVVDANNPLKVCINDRTTPYRISATLELIVDGQRADIPANIGFTQGEFGECQRTMYTLRSDGTIYAEWETEYPFEIGHFLWMWNFPLRDMETSQSTIYVNDVKSPQFINALLQDGYHYRAEFVSKDRDQSQDQDFMPPSRDE